MQSLTRCVTSEVLRPMQTQRLHHKASRISAVNPSRAQDRPTLSLNGSDRSGTVEQEMGCGSVDCTAARVYIRVF